MSIPKRVRSDKRIVWHDGKYQVYLKDNKLMYQNDKWIWLEIEGELLSYDELMSITDVQLLLTELNKYPLRYFETLTDDGHMMEYNLVGAEVSYNPEENIWWENPK